MLIKGIWLIWDSSKQIILGLFDKELKNLCRESKFFVRNKYTKRIGVDS